jgi:nitric oxide reductase NorD protein
VRWPTSPDMRRARTSSDRRDGDDSADRVLPLTGVRYSPRVGPIGPERFQLLASAIAGSWVEVASVDPGELSWTDGVTVFIDSAALSNHQLTALAVQSSLLGAGSLEPGIIGVLSRRTLARRYLSIEAHRALGVHEHLLPLSVRSVIDRSVAGRTDSPAESLAIASSDEELEEPPEEFGTIWPKRMRRALDRLGEQGSGAWHVPRREAKTPLRELDDADEGDGPIIDLLSSPVEAGGGLGRLLKRLFSETRSTGAGPPGAESPSRWSRHGTPVARAFAISTTTAAGLGGTAGDVPRGTVYPEWDVHKKRYKLDWCTVLDVDPSPTEHVPYVLPDTHVLRKVLSPLGTDLERQRRQFQGDDIDIDAAVEARVELKAGSAPREAVYIDTLRRRRELAVLVLLDVSGSVRELGATGVPVHEQQRAAAAALTTVLHELGDRVALYGFRSQGRSAVHFVRIKRFDDVLDTSVLERIGGIFPGGYTRLGAAIRHGAAVLERDSGTSRRVLAVISDGFAYDHGYERSYGEADSRRALAETRSRGIGSLCLSIGAVTDADALQRVFGTAALAAIPRVEQLPMVAGPLFRSALHSAELQRTLSQRRVRARERLTIERRTA